jgi:hypothetical protein
MEHGCSSKGTYQTEWVGEVLGDGDKMECYQFICKPL